MPCSSPGSWEFPEAADAPGLREAESTLLPQILHLVGDTPLAHNILILSSEGSAGAALETAAGNGAPRQNWAPARDEGEKRRVAARPRGGEVCRPERALRPAAKTRTGEDAASHAEDATNTAAKKRSGQDRSKPEGSAHMRLVDGARRTFIQLTAHMRPTDDARSPCR